MMVRITGGVYAILEAPILIFQNPNRSFPIRGVSSDVLGLFYRSGRKGWMDNRGVAEWRSEPRAIEKGFYGRRHVLFVDNCSGHNGTAKTSARLAESNTELRKLLPKCCYYGTTCGFFCDI